MAFRARKVYGTFEKRDPGLVKTLRWRCEEASTKTLEGTEFTLVIARRPSYFETENVFDFQF